MRRICCCTSGIRYRELELSKKLPTMPEDEQFRLLASDGMLVKRPLLIGDGFVLVGFKVKEWVEESFKQNSNR